MVTSTVFDGTSSESFRASFRCRVNNSPTQSPASFQFRRHQAHFCEPLLHHFARERAERFLERLARLLQDLVYPVRDAKMDRLRHSLFVSFLYILCIQGPSYRSS